MTLNDLDVRTDGADSSFPPPAAGGIRARRRRHRKQLRRRKQRRILTVIAAAGVIAALIAFVPHPGRSKPKAGDADAASAPAVNVHRVVLAHQAADGSAAGITVFSPNRQARGGTIILIPPGTLTEVASLGIEPVGQSLSLGGPARLASTLANLLGVDLSDVVVLNDAQLTSLAQPFGALSVKIPTRVERVDAGGSVEILYEPGVVEVQPSEVPQLLTVRGRGTALDLLARHQVFWQALLDRLQTAGAAKITAAPALQRVLGTLSKGDFSVKVLPVQSMGNSGDASAADQELYQVDASELSRFLASAFPDEARRIVARPRVQVLNGTGGVEVAPRIADKLVPAGLQVTLTGNADRFDYTQTQIVFYDRSKQVVAERVRKALGVGRLVLSLNPLDVVDVTVIVGKDLTNK
jgi:hypothetical protein